MLFLPVFFLALVLSATALATAKKSLQTPIREAFCHMDKPLFKWNAEDCNLFLGDLWFREVLSPNCVKSLIPAILRGIDFMDHEIPSEANCSAIDKKNWALVLSEVTLASTQNDKQVCERGVYDKALSELVAAHPTGAEDHSLAHFKAKYPAEFYSVFAGISQSPFFTMLYLRFKLGEEFDEIIFGHDEAKQKSPYSVLSFLVSPGILWNKYLDHFLDTDPFQVRTVQIMNVLRDIIWWGFLFGNPREWIAQLWRQSLTAIISMFLCYYVLASIFSAGVINFFYWCDITVQFFSISTLILGFVVGIFAVAGKKNN